MKEIIILKMKQQNMSQSKLAILVGVKQQYISKILLGKVESPSFKLIVKISEVLDIDLNVFKEKETKWEN